MSKFSNLYDIDGNIINESPQHTYTLEETEKLVDDLTKKVEENPDNEVYKVYLNNAQKWLMKLYNEMSREDLMKRMSFITNQLDEAKDKASEVEQKQLDEIAKAMEKLKKEYDNIPEITPGDTSDEGGEGVADMVEQHVEEPTPIVMDEYVEPIEESA